MVCEKAYLEPHETIIHNHLFGEKTCAYRGSRRSVEGIFNISVLRRGWLCAPILAGDQEHIPYDEGSLAHAWVGI